MGFLKFSLIVIGVLIGSFLLYGVVGYIEYELAKPNTYIECITTARKLGLPRLAKTYPSCVDLFLEKAHQIDQTNQLGEIKSALEEVQSEIEEGNYPSPQEIMRRELWKDLVPKYETPKLEIKQFIK
jgi:hypothetical protein